MLKSMPPMLVGRWARWIFATGLFLSLYGRVVDAQVVVHFDQDVYQVSGPGESFTAKILIDGNGKEPGDNPIRGDLFSMGVLTEFPAAKAQLLAPTDVTVPPPLDHFGFDPGAFSQTAAGSVGVKGNVDAGVFPTVGYGQPLLATITLTNLASAPDSYPLTLDFFRTVGINEDLFVDGNGNVLDPVIEFRSARVVVVPEPTSGVNLFTLFLTLGASTVSRLRASKPRFASPRHPLKE